VEGVLTEAITPIVVMHQLERMVRIHILPEVVVERTVEVAEARLEAAVVVYQPMEEEADMITRDDRF